jgi:trigger factor
MMTFFTANWFNFRPDGSVFEGGISNTASVRLDQVKDEAIKASLIGLKKGDVLTFDIQKAYDNDAAKVAGLLKDRRRRSG